jgi:hypothetical protein
MKAIKALEIVSKEGLNNTQYEVVPRWGELCRYNDMNNVEFAEFLYSTNDYKALAISIWQYTPVESALLVWREDKEEESVFSEIEEPLVVVMLPDGAVVEVYELV